jgi:hypothetical protein
MVTGPAGAKRLEFHAQPCYRGHMTPRTVLFSTRLPANRWVRWVVEIKWSSDPDVGYVRLEEDGNPVRPAGCAADGRCTMATMYTDSTGTAALNHFKLGNYRAPAISFPTVVFYRQVRISDTRDGVG